MSGASSAAWSYASILVPMDLDPAAEARVKLAAGLADRFASRLIGAAAQPIAPPLYFEAPVEGVPGIIEIEERRTKEDLAKAEATFRHAVGTRDRIEWRQALAFPQDFVIEQARAADLIVAPRPHRGEGTRQPMSVDSGDLVMHAGRAVLFVPPGVDHLNAKRAVVAWKDTREARRALWDAMPLLKLATEVTIVAVDSTDRGARDVAGYLGCHGIEVAVLSRPESGAPVAGELVKIAQQEGADLIVCGAYGHSRAREWIFGGVTRELLDASPLCCLMAH